MASTTLLLQNAVGSLTIYLQDTDGNAATGLTFADVSADLKKAGGSFSAITLSGTNFTELGSGFYELDLEDTDTDVLGNLYVRVSGATIDTALFSAYVAASAPVNPTGTTAPSTTTIFGYLASPSGDPEAGASVQARVLNQPALLHPGDEGVGVTSGLVSVKTDSDGFFTMELLTGLTVDFFIPSVNYRRTFVVPVSSTNVFDLA